MSFDLGDDELLASLDPIDGDVVDALVRQDDLVNRIVQSTEPQSSRVESPAGHRRARERLARTVREAAGVGGHRRPRVGAAGPHRGRAAFAATVAGLAVAAVALVAAGPRFDRSGAADRSPLAGENALDAAPVTPLSVTVPETVTGIGAEPASPGSTPTGPGQAMSAMDQGSTSPTTATSSSQGPAGPTTETTTSATSTWRRGPATGPATTTRSITTHPTTTQRPTTQPTTERPRPEHRPFDAGRDLLSLHHDQGPDGHGGLAIVAGREVANFLGIDPIVVAGTGRDPEDDDDPEDPEDPDDSNDDVLDITWGPNAWYDAHGERTSSVWAVAYRWKGVLRAGGDIWVAEGGRSDFSADVLRAVRANLPSVDTSARVHIVQHNVHNERTSTADDLDYLMAMTDYVRIEDGSDDNATADLETQDPDFARTAGSSRFASAWEVAFDALDDDGTVDFSDTVAVLHIVGIARSEVADPKDFAEVFMR